MLEQQGHRQSWSRQGEVRPCCAADAPECNTVNVSWFGPLIPCAGTKACGDLPGAERMVYDLGLLQFAPRTTGLGPNFTTPWIGLHSVHDVAGDTAISISVSADSRCTVRPAGRCQRGRLAGLCRPSAAKRAPLVGTATKANVGVAAAAPPGQRQRSALRRSARSGGGCLFKPQMALHSQTCPARG